jgi:hypothetical protein
VSDLSTRVDDWSFQVIAENSARFFVRVTSSMASKTNIVFSDFILKPDDDTRAVEALHLLKGQGFPLAPSVKLVFQDIHPSYRRIQGRQLYRRNISSRNGLAHRSCSTANNCC